MVVSRIAASNVRRVISRCVRCSEIRNKVIITRSLSGRRIDMVIVYQEFGQGTGKPVANSQS